MDGVLDASQLWNLDAYKGLPRVELDYPVVSLDEPHAICFVVCRANHENDDDKRMRVVMIDMRSKTLRSIFCYPKVWFSDSRQHLLPSRVSDYFNSEPSNSKLDHLQEELVPNLVRKIPTEMEPQNIKDIGNSLQSHGESSDAALQPSNTASPKAMILATLEEIPGLDRNDMLKAYRILSHDDSDRRFRSLMGLPMNLRKNCVLLEIKASEACFICSSCSVDLLI
ncbi:unnamed protein product [Urochloa humidicola]